MSNERAALMMDGNCGCALLGPNIQEGEVEFEEVVYDPAQTRISCERKAINRAFRKLKQRLNMPDLSYFIAPGHPDYL